MPPRAASCFGRCLSPSRVLASGQSGEFSNPGEQIDNVLQYRSADGQTIGTVYVYYPGLAHVGLSAWATDNAIRLNSQTPVAGGAGRTAAAGGRQGVAVRADYSNYRGGNASSAAFVKADRWLVKLRVSGPDAGQVTQAMDALLAGIEWGAAAQPQPATQLSVAGCAARQGERPARRLPDPSLEEVTARGLITTFDGAGIEATGEDGRMQRLPSRVPGQLCLSSRVRGNGPPILRAPAGEALSVDGRTRLLAILSDSGTILEVVDMSRIGAHIVLLHAIGETAMLGSFDGVPSDSQIADIIEGRDRETARVRVAARHRPGRSVELHVVAPEAPRPATPVT